MRGAGRRFRTTRVFLGSSWPDAGGGRRIRLLDHRRVGYGLGDGTTGTANVTAFSVQADSGKPACTQADFSVSGTATVGAQVPVGTGGSWSGLSLNMTNSGANQDNCKSITVPIAYTANP